MRVSILAVTLAVGADCAGAQEAAPRRLTPAMIPVPASLATISGVRELRDGRLLVSDAKSVAVYLIDDKTHATKQIGSVGGDELQYAQPGGFYGAPADSVFLLDRGLSKVLVVSPTGAIVGSRSIKLRGTSSSSSADIDYQRVDEHALAYFTGQPAFRPARTDTRRIDSLPLVRLDPVKQHVDTVALLRRAETRVTQVDEHTQLSQDVGGSPVDAWGIASDGRVAVVHGSPYHVEWRSPDGRSTRGPTYAVPPIPFAGGERDSIAARRQSGSGGSVGVTSSGARGSSATSADNVALFADAKAPFGATDVIVSPSGRVFVARTQPWRSPDTIYDVFNTRGERIDRVTLAGAARIVGFGPSAAYAVVRGIDGHVTLAKYSLPMRD